MDFIFEGTESLLCGIKTGKDETRLFGKQNPRDVQMGSDDLSPATSAVSPHSSNNSNDGMDEQQRGFAVSDDGSLEVTISQEGTIQVLSEREKTNDKYRFNLASLSGSQLLPAKSRDEVIVHTLSAPIAYYIDGESRNEANEAASKDIMNSAHLDLKQTDSREERSRSIGIPTRSEASAQGDNCSAFQEEVEESGVDKK